MTCYKQLTTIFSIPIIIFGEQQQLLLDLLKNIDNAAAISTNAMSREALGQLEGTLCSAIKGSKLIHTNNKNGGNVTFPKPPPFVPVLVFVPRSDKLQTAIYHYVSPMHHPHFMHELVRCFSFLWSRPDQTPVLLVLKRQFNRYLANPPALLSWFPFDHGILEGLNQGIGLQVTKSYNGTGWPTDANILRVGPHGCILCHAFTSRCYRTA
jgi:hypothetical protein